MFNYGCVRESSRIRDALCWRAVLTYCADALCGAPIRLHLMSTRHWSPVCMIFGACCTHSNYLRNIQNQRVRKQNGDRLWGHLAPTISCDWSAVVSYIEASVDRLESEAFISETCCNYILLQSISLCSKLCSKVATQHKCWTVCVRVGITWLFEIKVSVPVHPFLHFGSTNHIVSICQSYSLSVRCIHVAGNLVIDLSHEVNCCQFEPCDTLGVFQCGWCRISKL